MDLDAVATYSCVIEGYVIEDVNTRTCVLVNNTAQWYPAEAPVCERGSYTRIHARTYSLNFECTHPREHV